MPQTTLFTMYMQQVIQHKLGVNLYSWLLKSTGNITVPTMVWFILFYS